MRKPDAITRGSTMKRMLLTILAGALLGLFPAGAGAAPLDAEAECRSISTVEMPGCGCAGRYFESRFGPEQGAAALHLVARSYVAEPRLPLEGLYRRFGAAELDRVAQKVLQTGGEVAFYCPFGPHPAD